MSKEYTTIVSTVKGLLDAQKAIALSEDLETAVESVKIGQYVPTAAIRKTALFVRFERSGAIQSLSGGLSRTERVLLVITCAAFGTSQEIAHDDAVNLLNNVQRVLANYGRYLNLWNAGRFGWSYSEDEHSPEIMGQVTLEPGTDGTVGHFKLLWSCDVRIGVEPL